MWIEAVLAVAWGSDESALDRYRAEAALELGDAVAAMQHLAGDDTSRARHLVLRAAEQAGLEDVVVVVQPGAVSARDAADSLGDQLAREVREAPAEARATARQIQRDYAKRPDLLAPLARSSDPGLRALGEDAAFRVSRRLDGLDLLGLYRARVLIRVADLEEAGREVAQRIAAAGDPMPAYRKELSPGTRRAAAALLARNGQTDVPQDRPEAMVAYAADLARAAWKVDPPRAAVVWERLRARVDSPRAALEHGATLLALDRPAEASDAARAALRMLAGPAPDDVMRRDLPRVAVAFASAWDLYARAGEATGDADGAALARWFAVTLHPTDERRARDTGWEGGAQGALAWAERNSDLSLPVLEGLALVEPESAGWATLGKRHEELGNWDLAFRSHALSAAPRSEDLARTWRWPGSPERAATTVAEGWRASQARLSDSVAALEGFIPQTMSVSAVAGPARGQPMKPWSAGDLSSGTLAGRTYLLTLWATWCGPCQVELPELDALARRMQPLGRELAIVAVSVDAEEASMRRWMSRHPLSNLHFAWAPALQASLGATGIPRSFLVDEGGVVVAIHEGYDGGDDAVFEAEIRKIWEK